MTSRPVSGSVSKRFFSERDLADVLGVSIKATQGWRLRGIGTPWRKYCGTIRYDVPEFDAWVQAQPGRGHTGTGA
jgi:hypothetical protein